MDEKLPVHTRKALRLLRIIAQRVLPASASRVLMSIYGIFTTRSISYSRYGEDLLIKSFFECLKIKQGIYCDIGCFHPIWGSNTYLLHKLGWNGICVDMDVFKLNAMKHWRGTKIICVLGAVTGNDGRGASATTYRFENRLWSDIDTIDKTTADLYKDSGAGPYTEGVSPTIQINKLLANHPAIDCLSIDIEGIDEEVVFAIDFSLYRPKLIVFEDNTTWGGSKKIKDRLEASEYNRLFISGGSIGYCDARIKMPQNSNAP